MKKVWRLESRSDLAELQSFQGLNPELKPNLKPLYSDPLLFLWQGASRNQTNPTYKRNVKSHGIHIKLLERAPAFHPRLSFLLLAQPPNVTASVPKALPGRTCLQPAEWRVDSWSHFEGDSGVLHRGGGASAQTAQGAVVKWGFVSVREWCPGPRLFLLSK